MARTSLLDWTPAAGESGQRRANRALRRAFDRAAREHRVGKVRDVLAKIAAEAEAEYSRKDADADADADASEHAAEKPAKSSGKPAAKSSGKSKKAAEAAALAYTCGKCDREVAAGGREAHERTARHQRLTRLDA